MTKYVEAVRRADASVGVEHQDSEASRVVPASASYSVCTSLGKDPAINNLTERVTASTSLGSPARLLLTGSRPGDGTSSVAVALALDFSQRLAVATLLVDAQLRRPTLYRMLDGARPLDTAVRSDRSYQLKRTGLPRLDLATCRVFQDEWSADRFSAIETLMAQYQVAVVDLGVVRLDPAGLLLARPEDPILLVARCGYAERGQLSNTVNALAAANRPIGGVILNGRVNPIPRWVRRFLLVKRGETKFNDVIHNAS